jgi:hypothetical protein
LDSFMIKSPAFMRISSSLMSYKAFSSTKKQTTFPIFVQITK